MRTLIYRLFLLTGIVLSLVGLSSEKSEAAMSGSDVSIHELKEQPLVFSDIINANQNHMTAYHYSHSSHSSHASHSSHRSHYSSRW